MVVILVASTSGCLSVEAVKDFLLFEREEGPLVYQKTRALDFPWQADGFPVPDKLSHTANFKVKDGARYMDLEWDVNLISAFAADWINLTDALDPMVTLRLRKPTGEIVWERNFTESDKDGRKFLSPEPGTWTLRMEARAYGGEAAGYEIRDSFSVVVELYEPK